MTKAAIMNALQQLLATKSWKSSSFGLVVIGLGFLYPLVQGEELTKERIAIGVVGLALCFVRDEDKTSEAVGASDKEQPK